MSDQPLSEEAVFLAALAKPSRQEREAYLAGACAGDALLASRVRELLSAHDAASGPLDNTLPGVRASGSPAEIAERPGTQIGPYKLLQEIGQGGMGVVYMAEQHEPVKRRVALKIIKPGMDTRQVIARFEAERQALSLMDHPNIAKVLDAGTTDSERPYFVMELVKGQPITQYCDEHHLTPRQRLELLLPVCQAIQHAHQKGIIHRDIKPTNILVAEYDNRPVPKVIDFGVAKAISQSLTEKTMFTGLGQIVGTLEYMSPEQAKVNQLDIDTRSDIYSLGVLLYELLTGSTPFDKTRLRSAAFDEMLRIIREEEPPKPSTRLSDSHDSLPSISAQRHTEPAKLTKLVRGELDWIVMKALEKDRNRRYETANGFAADIERYLADEPVQACPPSAAYRFGKFARRNRIALLTTAVVAAALIVGATLSTWQAVRATRAEEQTRQLLVAEREAREQVIAARTREAEQQAQSSAAIEADLTTAAQLQAEGNCPRALAVVQQAEASLVGSNEELRRQLRMRVHDLEKVVLLEDIRLRRTGDGMAMSERERYTQMDQDYAAAFQEFGVDDANLTPDEVANRLRATSVAIELAAALDHWTISRDPLRLDSDGWQRLQAIARTADPDRWRNQYRDTMNQGMGRKERLRELAASADVASLPSQTLVLLTRQLGFDDGRAETVALLERAWSQHPNDFWITRELAGQLLNSKPARNEEGFRYQMVAVALRPQSAILRTNLGYLLIENRRLQEAITQFREAIRLQPNDPWSHIGLARALQANGQVDEGIASIHEALRLRPDNNILYRHLGSALLEKGDQDAAIVAYRKAVELRPQDASNYHHLGNALSRMSDRDGALEAYSQALKLSPREAIHHVMLGNALRNKGRLDEAIVCFRKAVELQPDFHANYGSLASALASKGQSEAAITAYRKAVELQPDDAGYRAALGQELRRKGLLDEAIGSFRKAVELQPNAVSHYANLGLALQAKGQLDEAIDYFRKALELQPNEVTHYANLGRAHQAKGRLDEAIGCFRKAVELQPRSPGYRNALGLALHAKGRLDEAIGCFRSAVKLNPKDSLARRSLASTLAQNKEFEEAIAVYRQSIELSPNDAVSHNNLAQLLATCADSKLRDPTAAVALARRAIELDPRLHASLSTLGVALYRSGDWSAAVEAINRATEQQAATAVDSFFLAMAHWQLDHQDEARRSYEQAVAWMEQRAPRKAELLRFRAEAAELLGITLPEPKSNSIRPAEQSNPSAANPKSN